MADGVPGMFDQPRIVAELAALHDRRPCVHFGPDAFVLYPGGVRRAALELVDALRGEAVDANVPTRAEAWSRSHRAPASTSSRALLQIEAAAASAGEQSKGNHFVSHSLYYDALQISRHAPRVVTVYDMLHERFNGGRILRRLKKRAITRADCLVVISAATAKDITADHSNVPRIVVIPLGLSPIILDTAKDPVGTERAYLLYVGPRAGYKNFRVLINALPRLADTGLALVLVGGEPLADWERRELTLGLGGRGAWSHVRPTDVDLTRLYDGAAATVVTSKCEGFGLPLLEAMARGCPVAASRGGSLPEVAGGMAELFDPDSAPACADAIQRALRLDDKSLLEASAHARAFTWQKSALRHRDLYRELLAR